MGNCCWRQCVGLFRREAGRLQRGGGGGGSKYFRTCPTGEHFTIEFCSGHYNFPTARKVFLFFNFFICEMNWRRKCQTTSSIFAKKTLNMSHKEVRYDLNANKQNKMFENLVESDEGESPGSSHRPLTEEEIADLRERHYDSIAEKQKTFDMKIQREQERQRIMQRSHHSNTGEYQSSGTEEDFESYLRNIKSQYEVFRSSRLSSEATVLTPNTESSCDLMTKTKSTSGNDDSTSLDLEWEDEEGMNRMIPLRERSKTEEDILRAALKYSSKKTGSNPTSASDDSNGLEWENDFVSAEVDNNGNSEYSGFVNPVLELSASEFKNSETDQQDR
ncbi:AP-1 complex-associated regulatory protein isoform X2 [Macrotis lagotis]|uniref:AP-1 complex-associated regulatory protein isoform X2 n=1 Tax=Macrotis lagotis TaxID=92651 RepID=UPI003D680786